MRHFTVMLTHNTLITSDLRLNILIRELVVLTGLSSRSKLETQQGKGYVSDPMDNAAKSCKLLQRYLSNDSPAIIILYEQSTTSRDRPQTVNLDAKLSACPFHRYEYQSNDRLLDMPYTYTSS